jgi:hypothetical protein
MPKFKPSIALREHMLNGHPITILEALLLFGVQSPNRTLTTFKKNGFLIASRQVQMAKVITRINKYTVCKVPEGLPYKEIQLTEYWIKK